MIIIAKYCLPNGGYSKIMIVNSGYTKTLLVRDDYTKILLAVGWLYQKGCYTKILLVK